MAQAHFRSTEMRLDYVNVPKTHTAPPISADDKKLLRLVLLSFGLLCMVQATLNVALRFVLYSSNGPNTELQGSCINHTERKWNNFEQHFRDGWLYFNTSLYYISTVKKSRRDSRSDCLQKGADLIVINSKEEQEFTRKFHRFMWIGLEEIETRWIWVDGTPLTTSYWGPDEPNKALGQDENCVEVRFFEIPNTWNDRSCQDENNWICEKTVAP